MSLFDEKTPEQHVQELDEIYNKNVFKKIIRRVRALLRRLSCNKK